VASLSSTILLHQLTMSSTHPLLDK
jgi:hypothetical protein